MKVKSFKVSALCAILCCLVAITPPVHAQWNAYDAMMSNNSYSRGWVNPYNNTMSNIYRSNMNMIVQQSINRSMLFNSRMSSGASSRRILRLKSMPPRERTEAEKFAKYNGTMYRESKAVNTPAKVAAIFSKGTGLTTNQLQPAFVELLNLYKKQAKSQNAPSADLARTMAYCISANYYYFTGGTGVPETQVAELRKKLRIALSEDKKFRAMTNAQKQEWNESMIILTHFAALGFEVIAPKASGDKRSAVREGYKALAGNNLKGLLGVEPSRVRFDKTGLVIS